MHLQSLTDIFKFLGTCHTWFGNVDWCWCHCDSFYEGCLSCDLWIYLSLGRNNINCSFLFFLFFLFSRHLHQQQWRKEDSQLGMWQHSTSTRTQFLMSKLIQNLTWVALLFENVRTVNLCGQLRILRCSFFFFFWADLNNHYIHWNPPIHKDNCFI